MQQALSYPLKVFGRLAAFHSTIEPPEMFLFGRNNSFEKGRNRLN